MTRLQSEAPHQPVHPAVVDAVVDASVNNWLRRNADGQAHRVQAKVRGNLRRASGSGIL